MSDRDLYLMEKRRGFSFNGRTSKDAYKAILFKYLGRVVKYLGLSVAFVVCSQILLALADKLNTGEDFMGIVAVFGFINLFIVFPFISICCLARMMPVTVRRLHDFGVSGYILLVFLPLVFIPIGALFMMFVMIGLTGQDGNPEANNYGSPYLGAGISSEMHDEPIRASRSQVQRERSNRRNRNARDDRNEHTTRGDGSNDRGRYSGINPSLFE